MGYAHFGKQAEVWKHLPLCDVMVNEMPQVYIETNSAYADYLLTSTPEQMYGIYHFIEKAKDNVLLKNCGYFQLENTAMKDNIYLGSPALAMNIFREKIDKYIFYDIDREALRCVERYAENNSLKERTETICQDSRIGMKELLKSLPPSTFIHIDPYEIIDEASNGYSYLDLFIEAADLGLKCFLWYGYNTLNEKDQLNRQLKEKVKFSTSNHILCKELTMEIIEKETIPCNPGILGSGLLTCNLSDSSSKMICDYGNLLVGLWKDTKYLNFRGDLYHERII